MFDTTRGIQYILTIIALGVNFKGNYFSYEKVPST